ncbi:hypothetical protein Hdeb2414_s0016g00481531 [Helianthus debilis subsp. tardiflorus]
MCGLSSMNRLTVLWSFNLLYEFSCAPLLVFESYISSSPCPLKTSTKKLGRKCIGSATPGQPLHSYQSCVSSKTLI